MQERGFPPAHGETLAGEKWLNVCEITPLKVAVLISRVVGKVLES